MSLPDLFLRPFVAQDANAFASAVNSSLDTLLPWMVWAHAGYQPEEALDWFNFTHIQRSEGRAEEFAIVDADNRLLGGAGIRFASQPDINASLGYWVRSDAQRQGVATFATKQLIALGFNQSDCTTLEILAAADNFASCAVALRCGFTLSGYCHGLIILENGPVNTAIYHLRRA